MEPQRSREGTLVHVVETLLDKGLVLNADIMVSVAGVELLGIRIRAALASFETAARYGLEFPAGTNTETVAWQDAIEAKDTCPQCGKKASAQQLLNEFCPWCGWESALALRAKESHGPAEVSHDGEKETHDGEKESHTASSPRIVEAPSSVTGES
ncbi:gas vesicle protein GvpJ [Citricoccus sp. GCM10030269]|uniref:gas vesicle protein GvpJ n=1 Tax=Citricoccus sp. GCM10030269 TaxID=3273388 RepID=UPI0036117533